MAEAYDEHLLLAYVEGELTSPQRAEFEQQMGQDDRLRRLVAQLQQDRTLLRQTPGDQAPPQVMAQVQQQLERALRDMVAAVRTKGHHRLAGSQHQRRRGSEPGPFARFDRRRMPVFHFGLGATQ